MRVGLNPVTRRFPTVTDDEGGSTFAANAATTTAANIRTLLSHNWLRLMFPDCAGREPLHPRALSLDL